MKIKKFNENFDESFKIDPIVFNNSNGVEKIVYPCVMIDFMKTTWQTRDSIRKEMDDLMWNQGFQTYPQFVDVNGNKIIDNAGVIELRDKYPGFKFVFYVEEKNLEKAEQIANKFGVEFYNKN
jgi:hypothetical protein